MDKSAHKAWVAGRWLAMHPEKSIGAMQLAEFVRNATKSASISEVVHVMANGCLTSRP